MEGLVEYCLAVTTDADGGHNIDNVRSLTESEYATYTGYISQCEGFAANENLFLIVEHSYEDLHRVLTVHLDEYNSGEYDGPPNLQRIALDLNRLVLSLLSSIRTYVDHTETRLKRQFGDTSLEVQDFKRETGKAFDESFAYRFTEKLRNYAQHCGLPIGRVALTSNSDNTDELLIQFNRDELLKNFSGGWGKLKQELEQQPVEFDVVPLLTEKVNLLRGINTEVNKKPLQLLARPGRELLELIIESQMKKPGAPHLLKISGEEDSPTLSISYFPYDIISRVTGMKFNFI